jgi:hypothetical protein
MRPGRGALRSDRRGIVLTLSVIIVTTLVASGLYISNRLIQNFTDTRNLYLTASAFYGAETAAEAGLFTVKLARNKLTTVLCTGTSVGGGCAGASDLINVLRTAVSGTLAGSTAVFDVSDDSTQTSSLEDSPTLSLQQNSATTLSLFPPDTATNTLQGGGFNAPTQVKLVKPGGATADPFTWVEVRWTGFSPSADPALYGLALNGQAQLVGPAGLATGTTVNLLAPPGSGCTGANCQFNFVSLRALYGNLGKLTVFPLDAIGSVVKIPNRLVLTGLGTVGSGSAAVSSTLRVTTAWRPSATQLFNYTLFSEQTINK